MNKYHSGWHQFKIGEFLKEHSERSSVNNQHEVLSVTKEGIFSQREYFKKQIASEDNSGYKIVKKGDVVFSAMNLWMGSIDVVKNHEIGIVSPAYITMRPNENLIHKEFLSYFLRGEKMMKKYIYHSQQGASIVRRNLNKNDLLKDKILIPPIHEQSKIAEILSGIDQLLENINKQISKLQYLQRGVMCDLLSRGIYNSEFKKSDLGLIPNTWETGNLSEIVDMVFGFAFSSSDFVENGLLCVRMGNLYNNQFNQSRSPAYLPKEFIKKYPKFIINAGDLLISMTGTAGKRDYGFVVEVPNVFEQGLLNQRVAKILPKNSNSKKFIAELMRSEFYLEKLFAFGSGTKQANLSLKQILGIVVPIPPIDEQVKIGEIISSLERNISEKQQRFLHLQILKDSLVQDLLSGSKRVKM